MCVVKPVPEGFTCWDSVVFDIGDCTIAQLLEEFPKIHHGCKFEYVFFELKFDFFSPLLSSIIRFFLLI